MKPRCYLDHNATSPLRPEARAAMIAAFDCTGNPSSIHGEGRAARQIVENARETVAALFEVEPAAVYFTSGGTEAANWLLQPRGGETLAVCAVEHPCVLSGHRFEIRQVPPHPVLLPASSPWRACNSKNPHPQADAEGRRNARNSLGGNSGVLSPLGERDRVRGDFVKHSTGFSIIPVFEDGALDLDALEAALSPGSVAAVQAANNETGVVQLTAEIAGTVHSKGAGLICDAVQAVGRLPLRELKDADVLFFSAHKFGGPKGVGAAIVRNPAFTPAPLLKGGGQERRQRSGTENVPGIAGLAAALEVAVSEQAGFAVRAKALRDKLERGIRDIAPDAVIFGLPALESAGEDRRRQSYAVPRTGESPLTLSLSPWERGRCCALRDYSGVPSPSASACGCRHASGKLAKRACWEKDRVRGASFECMGRKPPAEHHLLRHPRQERRAFPDRPRPGGHRGKLGLGLFLGQGRTVACAGRDGRSGGAGPGGDPGLHRLDHGRGRYRAISSRPFKDL